MTRLSLTCKRLEHLRIAKKIKTILAPTQEELDDCLRSYCQIFNKSPHTQQLYAQLLLDMGSNVNIQNKDGETLLCSAIQFNDIEIAEILLKNGANMYLKGRAGWIPSQYACLLAKQEILKLFILYGLDTSIEYQFTEKRKGTLTEWARWFRYEEVYELITHKKLPKKAEDMPVSELLYETTSYVYNLLAESLQQYSSFME